MKNACFTAKLCSEKENFFLQGSNSKANKFLGMQVFPLKNDFAENIKTILLNAVIPILCMFYISKMLIHMMYRL